MEKPICPNCSNKTKEVKAWDMKGGKGGTDFRVHLFECLNENCRKRFRKLERI